MTDETSTADETPKPKRTRKTTKKTTRKSTRAKKTDDAPAPSDDFGSGLAEQASADAAAKGEADEAPARKKPARRTSRRKKADEEPAADEPSAVESSDDGNDGADDDEPRRGRGRGRGRGRRRNDGDDDGGRDDDVDPITRAVMEAEPAPSGDDNRRGRGRKQQRGRGRGRRGRRDGDDVEFVPNTDRPPMNLADLQGMPMPDVHRVAADEGVSDFAGSKKQELIFRILKTKMMRRDLVYGHGVLEVMSEGHGFLRSPWYSYHAAPDDIFVSPQFVKRFNLRTGQEVFGPVRPPKEGERHFALQTIDSIDGYTPEELPTRLDFDDLTALYPEDRLLMETDPKGLEMRIMDIITPIGKGQRGLIVSPPRAGKTIILQRIADSIARNHPECHLIVLLIDERPEEVTDMRRTVQGEVVASTFDQTAAKHVHASQMVIERARRLVEYGKDVVILLDSITRLARAFNTEVPNSGKILSGGVDANALQRPKRFFGAARNCEEGGSLTIIGTALIDTGSRMDEVIYEEFKGTGNMELHLERKLADKRIFPAFDITRSGTRKEELLMDPEELKRVWVLRKILNDMNPADAMELLKDKVKKSKSNPEFLLQLNLA